ncbi:MAG TPA: PLP-dependent aspartate aminotransferase family protein, partial [Ardenticatenaceae bacterium]|nr:PLP-dependent aspartate aminotransferase family protein [Ardenticatenaceae bacterium]
MDSNWGPMTRAIHSGELPDDQAVAPPIVMASTFAYASAEEAAHAFETEDRPIYTRWGNPTLTRLEVQAAALEGGAAGLACASGMAAISTALLTLLRNGDHLVVTTGLYAGTFHLVMRHLPQLGVQASVAEAAEPGAFEAAIRPNTRAIYLESPGNPTLALNDLAAIAEIARGRGITTVIDNTFATPVNQQPLSFGIDLVVHSATKFFAGHGDAMGGLIVGSAELIDRARKWTLRHYGAVMSPFNAWLIARATETLPLRMARHNANALALADWLARHPAVREVRYPYHPSHPQFELARRQMRGGGGVVVFILAGGLEAGRTLLNRVKLIKRTVSLGDTRTLLTHPASTTHYSVPREARLAAGLPDGLVRMAVGLEDVEDLIADLEQAL